MMIITRCTCAKLRHRLHDVQHFATRTATTAKTTSVNIRVDVQVSFRVGDKENPENKLFGKKCLAVSQADRNSHLQVGWGISVWRIRVHQEVEDILGLILGSILRLILGLILGLISGLILRLGEKKI